MEWKIKMQYLLIKFDREIQGMVDSYVFIISQILKLLSGDVKAYACIISRVQQNILIICKKKIPLTRVCKVCYLVFKFNTILNLHHKFK